MKYVQFDDLQVGGEYLVTMKDGTKFEGEFWKYKDRLWKFFLKRKSFQPLRATAIFHAKAVKSIGLLKLPD